MNTNNVKKHGDFSPLFTDFLLFFIKNPSTDIKAIFLEINRLIIFAKGIQVEAVRSATLFTDDEIEQISKQLSPLKRKPGEFEKALKEKINKHNIPNDL